MGKSAFAVVLSLALAFVVNMVAELYLLPSEKRHFVALGKSLKAIIIPALIAAYALVIAETIAD